jgi:hypothetical protein
MEPLVLVVLAALASVLTAAAAVGGVVVQVWRELRRDKPKRPRK